MDQKNQTLQYFDTYAGDWHSRSVGMGDRYNVIAARNAAVTKTIDRISILTMRQGPTMWSAPRSSSNIFRLKGRIFLWRSVLRLAELRLGTLEKLAVEARSIIRSWQRFMARNK
jgi:hypothetical protein